MRLIPSLSLVILAAACDAVLPTQPDRILPAPVASPPPPAPVIRRVDRAIVVGETVEETLKDNGDGRLFELTAPADGTLVVRVTWDTKNGRLELWYGTKGFVSDDGSIVATIPVTAGQKYQFSVDDGAPWDYGGLNLPFVLTTALE